MACVPSFEAAVRLAIDGKIGRRQGRGWGRLVVRGGDAAEGTASAPALDHSSVESNSRAVKAWVGIMAKKNAILTRDRFATTTELLDHSVS